MNKFFESLAAQEIGKILIIGLGLTAFYWMSVYDDGSGIDAQVITLNQQLTEEEAKKKDTDNTLKQVAEMQEKVGQLSQKYQDISRRLPAVLFSIDINRAIDDFARTSGVSVKQKKPSETKKREVVEEIPVDVTLEGNFAELAQFTFQVSTAERMSRVKNVIITSIEGSSAPVSAQAATAGRRLKFDGQVVGYKLVQQPAATGNPPTGGRQ